MGSLQPADGRDPLQTGPQGDMEKRLRRAAPAQAP